MRTLAIESSTHRASFAFATGPDEVHSFEMPVGNRTASWLTAAIDRALGDLAWDRRAFELIALTSGPGSFTGLRIAVTTAKMLAYAWRIPIVELDSLHVIASQVPEDGLVWVAMDARQDELFVSRCERHGAEVHALEPTQIISRERWLTSLGSDVPTVATGPALERLATCLPKSVIPAPAESWYPTADAVVRLGLQRFQRHEMIEPQALAPRYYRTSYAERS